MGESPAFGAIVKFADLIIVFGIVNKSDFFLICQLVYLSIKYGDSLAEICSGSKIFLSCSPDATLTSAIHDWLFCPVLSSTFDPYMTRPSVKAFVLCGMVFSTVYLNSKESVDGNSVVFLVLQDDTVIVTVATSPKKGPRIPLTIFSVGLIPAFRTKHRAKQEGNFSLRFGCIFRYRNIPWDVKRRYQSLTRCFCIHSFQTEFSIADQL